MDSFNFRSVIFHPNTEQNLIILRDSLLEKKYDSFFPLFPLHAVLKNDTATSEKHSNEKNSNTEQSGVNQKPSAKSARIKKEFSNCKNCMIYAEYLFAGILFFAGRFDFNCNSETGAENQKADFFLVPAAIQKKTDGKSLPSVFKTAQNAVNELNKNADAVKSFSEFPALQFKSFQIADCIADENQYRISDSIWIKIIS
ncbi:MAG: hypothetical protein ACI4LX_11240 [Treponema sp.]